MPAMQSLNFFSRMVILKKDFLKLFSYYDSLEYDTKNNFLQELYAAYPCVYKQQVQSIFEKESDVKLFAICASYLFRCDGSVNNSNSLKIKMVEQFPDYDTIPILNELANYLSYHHSFVHNKPPNIVQLFKYQKTIGKKIIYSFQRYNRDYGGIAIVQNADGSFAKNADGRLAIFEQLARSGSNLPYFITNGNTPQGVYSIQGVAVSHNNFIGPTPKSSVDNPF